MTNGPETARVTIEGKSLEQALVKAAGTLGITQDELAYKVIKEETRTGLFSLFKNPVVQIEVWRKTEQDLPPCCRKDAKDVKEPKKQAAASCCDEVKETKAPLDPEKMEALIEELRSFCEGIVSRMAGEPTKVQARQEEGRLILDIEGEFMAQAITKNSKLAEAMEHVLRKKPRHLKQELPFRIFVDVGGVRRKREEDLIQMAVDLSAKVSENKRPIVLNYKSSYDRKIIHMALDKDERVYTKSIGSGPNRKLMILPVKGEARDAEATL